MNRPASLPRTGSATVLLLTLITLGLVVPADSAHASDRHVPPPVRLDFEITDAEIKSFALISAEMYEFWFKLDPYELSEMSDESMAERRAHMEKFLGDQAGILIDGIAVLPVVSSLYVEEEEDLEAVRDYVAVHFGYGTKGEVHEVGLSWRRWDTQDPWALRPVNIAIVHKGDYTVIDLSDDQPEYFWRPEVENQEPRRPFVPEPPATILVPVVSYSILGVLVLLLPVLMFAKPARRLSWSVIATACAFCVATAGLPPTEILPPWAPRVDMPDEEEARGLFESLHKNIYRAFDYDTESEIYDALAQSVDESLIDSVYREVYQSLILKDEGGAICDVRAVKVLSSKIELGTEDNPRFDVDCRWRVTGTVEHWGHSHWRINEYQARYTLHGKPGGTARDWRITNVQLESQERIVDQSESEG